MPELCYGHFTWAANCKALSFAVLCTRCLSEKIQCNCIEGHRSSTGFGIYFKRTHTSRAVPHSFLFICFFTTLLSFFFFFCTLCLVWFCSPYCTFCQAGLPVSLYISSQHIDWWRHMSFSPFLPVFHCGDWSISFSALEWRYWEAPWSYTILISRSLLTVKLWVPTIAVARRQHCISVFLTGY